jgi:hypothetical protein
MKPYYRPPIEDFHRLAFSNPLISIRSVNGRVRFLPETEKEQLTVQQSLLKLFLRIHYKRAKSGDGLVQWFGGELSSCTVKLVLGHNGVDEIGIPVQLLSRPLLHQDERSFHWYQTTKWLQCGMI